MKKGIIEEHIYSSIIKLNALVFTFNTMDAGKVPLTEDAAFGFGQILSEIEDDLNRAYEELESSMLIDLEKETSDEK